MPEHQLNEPWVIWMHSNTNSDWSLSSYKIISISHTLEELFAAWRSISNFTRDAMFFFMKGEYPPRWDEVQYENGGYISLKVDTNNSSRIIEEVLCKTVGLTLYNSICDDIVGISTSSKGKITIVKIWCTTSNVSIENLNLLKRLRDSARFTYASNKI
jgi:hypothetical protein